uniref:hypothetical protein n=1 Tax=Agathobacter sp. TaxID=2021311 RepID=UPI0040579259
MKWMEKIKAKMPGIILAFLLIVIMVILGACIQLHNKLEELGNQLMYLQDTNSILNEEIFSLQTNIEAALEEEASLIESYTVEVLSMDFEKGTYQVKVSVIPKSYSDTTRTSVFFGVNEFPLVLNRYSFEGTVELSFADAYDGNITFLFANGDKKNTEIAKDYVGIQTKLQELLYGSIERIPSYRNGQLVFDHWVEYSLNEYDGREYESLELVLMADEEELQVVNLLAEGAAAESDITDEEETENPASMLERGSRQEADREGNQQETTSEGRSNLANPQGMNGNGLGTDGLDNSVSQEKNEPVLGKSGIVQFVKNVQIEEGKTVRLFLRAKNEAGFILEYDLFSAVTSQTGPNGYEETEDYFVPDYTVYDEKRNGFKL